MISAQVQNLKNTDSLKTSPTQFDTVIVFGEGPVKPVLLYAELSPEQKQKWETYKKDRIQNPEPNFHVVEKETLLLKLASIPSQAEKEELRSKWQHNGWLALKRMGRQNALAAGYALYKGITQKVVLSGGKTIPKWAKELMSKEKLTIFPSEAILMRDIIRRYYALLYEKVYGKSIDEVIIIEEAATNTLENFAYTLNKYPSLLQKGQRVGFLSAAHHMKRLMVLSRIFSLKQDRACQLPAQELLYAAMHKDNIEYQQVDLIADEKNCEDIKKQNSQEERWIKALEDPQYLSYWLGYVAEVRHPMVLKRAIDQLKEPLWCSVAREEFKRLGLNVDDYTCEDIAILAKNNAPKYQILIERLRQFKKPEYRKMPPVIGLA